MAKLKILSSNSSGNCYILDCGNEQLIIECGIAWKEILNGLNYDLSKVISCIATHEHRDHLLCVKDAIKFNLSVYSNEAVRDKHNKVKVLKKGSKTAMGGFKVQPIEVPHSVPCYSFIIQHDECGKILFITDCSDFRYRVKGCDHIFIEANWDKDVVLDNMIDGCESMSFYENHLELEQTIEILKENYNENLKTIVLLHPSSHNLIKSKAVERVKEELCFDNVFMANKGLVVELNKRDYE